MNTYNNETCLPTPSLMTVCVCLTTSGVVVCVHGAVTRGRVTLMELSACVTLSPPI